MPPVLLALGGVAGFLGVTATQLAIGLLATAARIGLSYYQAQKAKQQRAPGQDIQQNIRQAATARYVVLGKARVAGVMWFYEAVDEKFYLATILSDDIIDGVDAYYVNNIECLVDTNNYVTTPPFNSSTAQYVRFELHFGYTDQVASPMLLGAFPGVITAAHTASGIAYLVTELQQPPQADFQTVFNGGVPQIACLVRGAPVYDMRDNTQDPNVSSTWKPTTNPALLLLHYFTANNGMGLSRGSFDGDSFAAVADFCDELIPTKTKGLRKRYELGGSYSYDEDPVDIAARFLDTFAGDIYVTSGGYFGLTCDELETPVITITEDMILELEAKRNTGALYEYSTILSRFTSEDHGYFVNNEEADPWIDADTRDRIGREMPFSFDLPYVFRHDQCRRLMKQKFYRLNPEWTLDLAIDFNGIELFGERVCRLVYAPLGIDQTFRVESVNPDQEKGLARIEARLTSISKQAYVWDATTEEGTAPAIPPTTSETAAPQTPTGLAALVGNSGGVQALVTWVANTTGHGQEAQWKATASGTWIDLVVAVTDRGYLLTGLTAATSYDFRVKVTDTRYGESAWATLTFVATVVAGTTGALISATAAGAVLKVTATAQQSAAATAAFIEFTGVANGAGVAWGGSTKVPALASGVVTTSFAQASGARDIYVRSVGINGDTGAVTGPIDVTVQTQISTGGTGGSGSGGGGSGKNDNGGNVHFGGQSTNPGQDDSGGNDGGGGGGGIY